MIHLVACELHGREHLLVGEKPVSAGAVGVVAAVLQKHAECFCFIFADQDRVVVAAALIDKSADAAEHTAELLGPFPCRGEGADRTAAAAGDAAVVALVGETDRAPVAGFLFFHLGQQFFENETHIIVAETVILIAAIVAVERRGGIVGRHAAMHDEDSDEHRDFLFRDEIVKHHRRLPLDAVLVHMHAGRLVGRVLRGHIDPVVAHRAGEDLAVRELEFQHFALGHAGLRFGVRAGLVVVGGVEMAGGKNRGGGEQEGAHGEFGAERTRAAVRLSKERRVGGTAPSQAGFSWVECLFG